MPLLFLQDVTGFMVGSRAERGGIIKDGAKLVNAVANSVVPKITVFVGNSYGAGNYAMCGKAYGARFLFAWPSAQIAVMGGEQASRTLLGIQLKNRGADVSEEEKQARLADVQKRYADAMDPRYAAARLWVDAIIDPRATRRVVARCLEACATQPRGAPLPHRGAADLSGAAVRFPYYARLTAEQKKTYRASDAIVAVELPDAAALRPAVAALERALRGARTGRPSQRAAAAIAHGICVQLGVPPVEVRVLARRPHGAYGELQGLYDPGPEPARITVWMRTVARKQVVAFRTFLRTLLHEVGHHLDYELYELEETFHTEGFFQRESSLVHQLLGEPPAPPGARRRAPAAGTAAGR